MTLELHRIVHLPQKVAAEFHKIMHLPREVPAEPHQIMKSFVVDPNENTMLWQLALHHFQNPFASLWGLQGLERSALHRRSPRRLRSTVRIQRCPKDNVFNIEGLFKTKAFGRIKTLLSWIIKLFNIYTLYQCPLLRACGDRVALTRTRSANSAYIAVGTCPLASFSRSNPYHIAHIGCSTCKGS